MKVVINACYGGFSLSDLAQEKLGVDTPYPDIPRNDPRLVEIVESLGREANGECAKLKIVEIPDDVKWHVTEYDGFESIHEDHRSWS